jgi:hypothetical protein
VPWPEFYEAFQEHHIPEGLIDRKQQKFLDLKQGSDIMYEYCKRFIYLVQYGSHHTDMDGKKTTLFRKGMCAKICEHLMPFQSWTFNQLMSVTIRQDDAICATKEEKKGKKAVVGPSRGASLKYRLVYTPLTGQPRGPPPPPQWGYRPPQQVDPHAPAYSRQPAPP